MIDKKIRVGIGFATGRKSFQKVLKTYVYNFRESGLTENINVHLSLFVAYDLKYANTRPTDYTNITAKVRDLIDDAYFIGNSDIQNEVDNLTKNDVIDGNEARILLESGGYATKRNALLYAAIKQNIDYLLFLDDDEYPLAVTNFGPTAVWSGQHVLSTHLNHMSQADITIGHHCGYVSPVPHLEFNDILKEEEFRIFIEAISNDIINWDSIRAIMERGGVTYADANVLKDNAAKEVPEINETKFISGSNLCLNLTDPNRVYPFYNPPGARGEDTFLSTCLSRRTVLHVPCYTFHDGFSTYQHLMDGVLPTGLRSIKADNDAVVTRFYRACIGWVRYKPLLLYITQGNDYEEKIKEMRAQLNATLPQICTYFGRTDFMNISKELVRYHRNVKNHYEQFQETQRIWSKIMKYHCESRTSL